MNMKKILLAALFALSFFSSCRAQTVFTFECFCGYLTIADGNCDVCGPTLQSRMFTGIIIRKNGVPHKWIETPYTVRFNGQVARFQELVYPNPEIINIDRSQTPYGTLDSFKMAIQCPCVGGGGRDTIVIDSSGAVCAALYFFANDTAAIASPTTDQYDYYLTAPENYYGMPAGLVKLAWETTLPDSASTPGCGSGGSGAGTGTVQLPYKSYVALLTQTGEDAPVATVVYNTLSGTPTWDYQVGGAYRINLTGEFTVNKTVAFISGANASGLGYTFTIQYLSVDTIRILSNSDNWLTNTAIEIRVYP